VLFLLMALVQLVRLVGRRMLVAIVVVSPEKLAEELIELSVGKRIASVHRFEVSVAHLQGVFVVDKVVRDWFVLDNRHSIERDVLKESV
jgi:hypothetical protein